MDEAAGLSLTIIVVLHESGVAVFNSSLSNDDETHYWLNALRLSLPVPAEAEELLTVGERLRSYRQQVTDPYAFRAQLWAGVKQADEEARRRGYSADDIELAVFAVVA